MSVSRTDNQLTRLAERSLHWTDGWPAGPRKAFRAYLAGQASPLPASRTGGIAQPDPYWLLLPLWLAKHFGSRQRPLSRRFLSDILDGQYALFLAIRILDDLEDGAVRSRVLAIAPRLLLENARGAFGSWFVNADPFWKIFEGNIRLTLRSLRRSDELRKTPGILPEKLLREYAGCAAIFGTAPAAICLRCGRRKDLAAVMRFIKAMAQADQILDDITDLGEDLDAGRFNVAAQYIVRSKNRLRRDASPAEALFLKLPALLAWSARLGERAAAELRRLGVHKAEPFLKSYRSRLRRLHHLAERLTHIPSGIGPMKN